MNNISFRPNSQIGSKIENYFHKLLTQTILIVVHIPIKVLLLTDDITVKGNGFFLSWHFFPRQHLTIKPEELSY